MDQTTSLFYIQIDATLALKCLSNPPMRELYNNEADDYHHVVAGWGARSTSLQPKKKKTYRTRQHEGWMLGCTCDEFDVNDVSVENENNKYFKLERNEEI